VAQVMNIENWSSHSFSHFRGPHGFWPGTFSHTSGTNKLRTLHEDRHDDETSQSFWKAANHVFEAEDSFIVLTTREMMGGSEHYSVSSHPPILVLS